MWIEVTQKHIDDAVKWAEKNIRGGDVCSNCIAARAISEAFNKPLSVGLKTVNDSEDIIAKSNEMMCITSLVRSDWKDVKPFGFELEMLDAG